MNNCIKWFSDISIKDIPLVGGKTASLGEMYRSLTPKGIRIPTGFAVTADAYTELMNSGDLGQRIFPLLEGLNHADVAELARTGHKIRSLIREGGLPAAVAQQIEAAYDRLCKETGPNEVDVAVRSSATAEDLPEASFAGQQETFLNIQGTQGLLTACLNCFASLFTDRAISYRMHHGFSHDQVRLSVCVQQMVRSDLGSAGVIFTLDTESGNRDVVFITSGYGLGENVVAGKIDPDEFLVHKTLLEKANYPILRKRLGKKQQRLVYSGHGTRTTRNIDVSSADQGCFSLSDSEVIALSKQAVLIEEHYTRLNQRPTPMDIEWGKDGKTGELHILQARPETVHANVTGNQIVTYHLESHSKVLVRGRAVGSRIGAGPVRLVKSVAELGDFKEGEVLVADMTDPDWEPVMKKASAIVTNRGGRTCHAAIVSRELGVTCIVGTGDGTHLLKNGQEVTVSCAEGEDGLVYEGVLPFKRSIFEVAELGKRPVQLMVNLGNPDQALKTACLPVDGVGLIRMEFIITESVKIHPMALLRFDSLETEEKNRIVELTKGFASDRSQYYVSKLAEGIALIAGAFYPRPVVLRFSDFKTNEYANLIGGKSFEPVEENPMIGFRGASRYYDDRFREAFGLECRAIKFVREQMGLTNLKVMVPFCRTPEEGNKVMAEMAKHGLNQGENGLEVYVMCEIPSNVLLAKEFADIFDGFSIGSNDLTQLVLGVDRDSSVISHLFDERSPSVKTMISQAIHAAKEAQIPIGICGQAPSDYPEILEFLISERITSISLSPDAVSRALKMMGEDRKK